MRVAATLGAHTGRGGIGARDALLNAAIVAVATESSGAIPALAAHRQLAFRARAGAVVAEAYAFGFRYGSRCFGRPVITAQDTHPVVGKRPHPASAHQTVLASESARAVGAHSIRCSIVAPHHKQLARAARAAAEPALRHPLTRPFLAHPARNPASVHARVSGLARPAHGRRFSDDILARRAEGVDKQQGCSRHAV